MDRNDQVCSGPADFGPSRIVEAMSGVPKRPRADGATGGAAANKGDGRGGWRWQPKRRPGGRREKLPRKHGAKDLAGKSGATAGYFPAYVELALAGFRTLLETPSFIERVRSRFVRLQLDADDGVQATALRLLNPDVAAGYKRERGGYEQFALAVASWAAFERWKVRGRRCRSADLTETAWSGASPLEVLEAAEREDAVRRAISGLSPELRRTLERRYFDGHRPPGAAMTPAECCSHSRALKKLRALLSNLG